MSFIFMALAGCFVFFFIAYLFTGSKVLSSIISVAALCSILGIWECKNSAEVKFNRKHQEQAKGVFSFAADLYNRNSPTLYYTLYKNGRLVEGYNADIKQNFTKDGKPKTKTALSYKITNLVYFADESEPCGFQLDVTNWKNKTETWRFHFPKKNFHNSNNMRLVPSENFDELVKIYNFKNDKVTSLVSEKAFCMDIIEP